MLHWDRLYLGGGNSRRLRERDVAALGEGVSVVSNDVGIIGGVRAWEVSMLHVSVAAQPIDGPQHARGRTR